MTTRWERSGAIELWQLEVMGKVHLTSGIGLSIVTEIDDHSRFCVLAKVVRATARPALRKDLFSDKSFETVAVMREPLDLWGWR